MAFLAVFSAILAVVASQHMLESWTYPEEPPVYLPEPPVYPEPQPYPQPEPPYPVPEPPKEYPPGHVPYPVPSYGPGGYGDDPLQKLRESVLQRIQEQKSKLASVIEFRDVTLVSIEKISSLTSAWCRSKYRPSVGCAFCCFNY